MKLTAKALAAHQPPEKSDYILFDDEIAGFGLRYRDGRQTWIFQYAIGTASNRITRRIKIGDYPALSPAKAREEAEDLHAKVHLHGDPAIERRKNRIDATKTVERLVQSYLEFQAAQLRPASFREVKRHLELYAKPLHGLPLSSVDQAIVAQRLSAIAKGNGNPTANRTRASLSAMFSWAMREGLALSNPVANTNKREEKTRNRVLSEAELRAIWQTLDDMDNYAVIIKLLMLTGQRAGEIAGLRWSEIDFHRNLICLPASRTKNNRPHNIPIAPGVRALLQPRECTSGHDPIFTTRGERFRDWSRHKHLLNARITEATGQDLQHWTPHDLRRTSATGMAEIGIQPHIIEAVLNHVSGHKSGIAGIYNRASYEGEKAAALVRWDEYIRSVVEGSAVPQLQGR